MQVSNSLLLIVASPQQPTVQETSEAWLFPPVLFLYADRPDRAFLHDAWYLSMLEHDVTLFGTVKYRLFIEEDSRANSGSSVPGPHRSVIDSRQ